MAALTMPQASRLRAERMTPAISTSTPIPPPTMWVTMFMISSPRV